MNNLQRVGGVEPSLGFKVRGRGFVGGGEAAEMRGFPVDSNLCPVFLVVDGDAKDSGAVIAAGATLVLSIFRRSDFTQVADPIVVPLAVDVVKNPCRPAPVMKGPCNVVGLIPPSLEVQRAIAEDVPMSGHVARMDSRRAALQPRQHASFGVISKPAFHFFDVGHLDESDYGTEKIIPHNGIVMTRRMRRLQDRLNTEEAE